jgi:signal transduction histidine kinase
MLDGIMRSQASIARHQAEQRVLETRLAESEKMAATGRLAAGVAHELGSPLSVVDGKAQRLLRRAGMTPAEKESLKDIRVAVKRIENIVRQLMELDRNNSQQRRPCRVEQLARSAIARLQPELDANRVTMELCDGKATDRTVAVNPHRIEQALDNVLRNALQAARGGHVRFGWADTGTEVVFRIEDDGPGIGDDILPRLFEPFFTTKPVGQGTGLGLALAHASLREHGRRMEVDRSSLGGAMVCLILPVRKSQESEYGNNWSDTPTELAG